MANLTNPEAWRESSACAYSYFKNCYFSLLQVAGVPSQHETPAGMRPHPHRTRTRKANGICWCEWECPHCTQATSKDLRLNSRSRPVWIGPKGPKDRCIKNLSFFLKIDSICQDKPQDKKREKKYQSAIRLRWSWSWFWWTHLAWRISAVFFGSVDYKAFSAKEQNNPRLCLGQQRFFVHHVSTVRGDDCTFMVLIRRACT